MTSFSTLSTALSALTTQRAALDVAGQNVANVNTVGYTRQRAETASVSAIASASRFSSGLPVGQGVTVTGVSRLGDIFADARVRSSTSLASDLLARADSLTRLESTITEPSDKGVGAQLAQFWASWQDLSNNPGEAAPAQVVLEAATMLSDAIRAGYQAVDTQWTEMRTQVSALVTEVNTTANGIAELNSSIRSVTVSGGNANELMDKRDMLVLRMSELTGATARPMEDGTVTVSIGGNPVVSGDRAYVLHLEGATMMTGAAADVPLLAWDRDSAGPVSLDGGTLAGMVSALAPANAGGTGGMLAEAARAYDSLATSLATKVNAIHSTGVTTTGAPGGAFYTLGTDPAVPPSIALTLASTDYRTIAAAAPGNGAFDGSIADRIAQIGTAVDSPDRDWQRFVVDLGVNTQSAVRSATVAENARSTAEQIQLAQTSVDIDEETINMLAFQRAYQGAARVMTTVDEMLDTLINRTGVVGR